MSAPASSDAEVLGPLLGAIDAFGKASLDARRIDKEKRIPLDVLVAARELGLFGLTLPPAYGGSGLGLPAACAAVAALAWHDRSVAVTVGLHLGLGTRGLVAFGADSLKERFLPGLASGERIAAFAATEPWAGSDLTAIRTTLQQRPGGWLLDGQKAYITNGAFAGVLTAVAKSPGLGDAERGQSVVVFDAGQKGVQRGAEEDKLGLRGSSTTGFFFDGVELPQDAVLGVPGEGATQLAHILCWGRLLMSAGCVGTARRALAAALDYTRGRKQFGRPLVDQPVVQGRLGKLGQRLYAMQALVEDAARSPNDEELVRLTTSSKVFCSEGAGEVCDMALQLHGGVGFIEESGLPMLGRDARVTRIFEGANDVLWTHRGMMEMARASPSDGAARVDEAYQAFRQVLLKEHGVRLFGKKEVLHRLGIAAMWRDAAAASLRWQKTDEERSLALAVEAEALGWIARVAKPDAPQVGVSGCDAVLAKEMGR